jgi:1,4-alpha-glucan branching enzyme
MLTPLSPHPSLQGDKVMIFDRGTAAGPLVFAFNFHPTASYTGYKVGAPCEGEWVVALDSDDAAYGGHGRIDHAVAASANCGGWNGRPAYFQAYLPARTCVVWKLKHTPREWL